MGIKTATYSEYSIWIKSVSEVEPTEAQYSLYSVSELQTIKSEADRLNGSKN